jgi:transcriptional regulator with XRE-family HTH domain
MFNNDLLEKLFKRSGLSQSAIGRKFSVSEGAVRYWLKEKKPPKLDTLARIARYFNKKIDDFYKN